MFVSYFDGNPIYDDYLEHHGILGMHWGIRRFQNKDGSLTAAGKNRYNTGKKTISKEAQKRAKVRSQAADIKAQAKLNEAKKELEKSLKKKPKLSREAKKRAKERRKVENLERDAELQRRKAEAIRASEEAAKSASDSRRQTAVAKENEKAAAEIAKANRIRAEEDARKAKREATDAAHREVWTPVHTKSGKNRAIRSGDPKLINKYASRMTETELKQALDAYNVKKITGQVGSKRYGLFKTPYGKEKAIRSGDPKKVKRYSSLMSNDEYKTAMDRCTAAADLQLANLKKLTALGQTIANGFESVSKIGTSVVSIHDTMATIYNATNKAGKTWKKWNRDKAKDQETKIKRYKFLADYGYDPVTGENVFDIDENDWRRKMYENKKGKPVFNFTSD